MGYLLIISRQAKRNLKVYKKKSLKEYIKIEEVLYELCDNPFSRKLRTHKVRTRKSGSVYSTRVTGDLRIIWNFYNDNGIRVVALGGHSGSNSVYS